MLFLPLLVGAVVVQAVDDTPSSSACSVHTADGCVVCASHTSGPGNCRWCPVDNACHDYGAIGTNPCTSAQNIDDPSLCPGAKPTPPPTPAPTTAPTPSQCPARPSCLKCTKNPTPAPPTAVPAWMPQRRRPLPQPRAPPPNKLQQQARNLRGTTLQSACSPFGSCVGCTSSGGATGQCRWCPVDDGCHDAGAIFTNPCTESQNIVNPAACPATPAPTPALPTPAPTPAPTCGWCMFLGKCTDKEDDCTALGKGIQTFVDKEEKCVLADADGFISGFAASCLASEKVNKVAGCFEAINDEAETLFGSDGLFVTVKAAVAEWTGSVVPTPAPPAQCHIPSTAADCSAPADWWAATKCVINALDATTQGLEKLVIACLPQGEALKAIKAMLIALAPGEGEITTTCKTLLNFIKVGEAAQSLYRAVDDGNWVLAGAALQEMLSGMIEDWPCDTEPAPPPPSPAAALALSGPLSDVNRNTSSYDKEA